ncbi:MAG: mycothiol transferase [Actinomycetota bacterium]
MDLERGTAELYIRHGFTQMLDVADRLGDAKVNERPLGPQTNAVAALIIHCCGVTEYWLGHVGLGRESERERESEFSATATVAELHALVEATLVQLGEDLDGIMGGTAPDTNRAGRVFLLDADESDGSLVLHVIEELFQHLGHAELAADALIGPNPAGS